MSTSREQILARLRKHQPAERSSLPPLHGAAVFADLPEPAEYVEAFRRRFEMLSGELHVVESPVAAVTCLEKLLPVEQPGLYQSHPLIEKLIGRLPASYTLEKYEQVLPDSPQMSEYAYTITAAEWLIARTGSIVVRTTGSAGRRMSVLPPLHVVVATEDQLRGSLEEALASLSQETDDWSLASVITGPSRTADIEKILVLGAHGPKRLAVVLLPACDASNG